MPHTNHRALFLSAFFCAILANAAFCQTDNFQNSDDKTVVYDPQGDAFESPQMDVDHVQYEFSNEPPDTEGKFSMTPLSGTEFNSPNSQPPDTSAKNTLKDLLP